MIVTKENVEDVKKYFQGTFVKFKEEGDKVYKISSVGTSHLVAQDSTGEEIEVNVFSATDTKHKPYEIDYVIPKRTVYQYGDCAAMLYRVPARMWRKGMDPRNTEFVIFKENGQAGKLEMTHSIIEGFVNKPGYYTFDDAVNNFQNGESLLSAALSPRVFITRKGGVHIDQVLVGRWTPIKREVTVKSIFVSDLQPLFPHTKIKEL